MPINGLFKKVINFLIYIAVEFSFEVDSYSVNESKVSVMVGVKKKSGVVSETITLIVTPMQGTGQRNSTGQQIFVCSAGHLIT